MIRYNIGTACYKLTILHRIGGSLQLKGFQLTLKSSAAAVTN